MHAKLLALVMVSLCACGGGRVGPRAAAAARAVPARGPRRARRGRPARRAVGPRQDRPAGRAVDSRDLRRLRRGGVRPDADVGGFAPRRRPHRLGGLAARHRRQAQPAAGALVAAAADRVRPRGRHQHPVQRRDAASPQYGRGRHGERQRARTRWDGSRRSRAGRSAFTSRSRRWPTSTTIPTTRSSTPARSARTRRRSAAWSPRRSAASRTTACWRRRSTFPGHGDTGTDSHLALPVIASDWARLDSVELVPFRSAIAAGREGGDVGAHRAARRSIAGELRPGTVAPSVLTGILRDSLGFDGLVVTDALNMGGIANAYGAEASVRAFLAGRRPAAPAGRSRRARSTRWRRAVARGRDHAGAARPLACGGCSRPSATSASSPGARCSLDSVPGMVGSARFLDEAREMAARSVVMVKDVNGTVHGLRAREAADHAGDLRRRGEPHRGPGARRGASAPGTRAGGLPALARERAGQLRLGRGRARPTAGGALRHRGQADRLARHHRAAGAAVGADRRERPSPAHDPGLAGQSRTSSRACPRWAPT